MFWKSELEIFEILKSDFSTCPVLELYWQPTHTLGNYSAIYLDLRNLNEQITLGVDYLLNKLHQTIEFAYEP